MKWKNLLIYAFLSGSAPIIGQTYTDGVFVLNEDWYGHNNSSINFLHPESGEIDYYLIQTNPANMDGSIIQTLGCTAQYGVIYGDKMYVISKQDQDPGENAEEKQGGRLVILDAQNMQVLYRLPIIAEKNGKSIADGRSFVGVDENKGYIGTSNGIYILDLNTYVLNGIIEGSENPLITGDESPSAGLGALYENQIGMMIRTQDHVLAIQQDKGILVINPETDKIEQVIPGCFSTIVQSKDGYVWVGLNSNSNEEYLHYPYGSAGEEWIGNTLLRIDPYTFETKRIVLPRGGINQTWYAWTAGSLCASAKENVLYFIYNEDSSQGQASWFTTAHMYKYDIDKGSCELIYDSTPEDRYFYGAGMRINPADDKIYAALYVSFISNNYFLYYQLDKNGKLLEEYEPISGYWYPAMFIFPDNQAPVIENFSPVELNGTTQEIDLSNMATDEDTPITSITKRVTKIENENIVSAKIKNNKLILTPLQAGETSITVRFNSNGKCEDRDLAVKVSTATYIQETESDPIHIFARNGIIQIFGIEPSTEVEIYNMQSQLIYKNTLSSGCTITEIPPKQIYIVKIKNQIHKIIL